MPTETEFKRIFGGFLPDNVMSEIFFPSPFFLFLCPSHPYALLARRSSVYILWFGIFMGFFSVRMSVFLSIYCLCFSLALFLSFVCFAIFSHVCFYLIFYQFCLELCMFFKERLKGYRSRWEKRWGGNWRSRGGNLIRLYPVRKKTIEKSKKRSTTQEKASQNKRVKNTHRKNSSFIRKDKIFKAKSYGFLLLFYLRYRLCRYSRLASNSQSFCL